MCPEYYKALGNDSLHLLREPAVLFIQKFRDYIGKPVRINNWFDGGSSQYSGMRPFNCIIGAQYSMHKYGGAFDLKVEGMSGEEMRKIVIDKYDTHFKGLITTIEDGTDTWLHADCRWMPNQGKLNIIPYWKKPT